MEALAAARRGTHEAPPYAADLDMLVFDAIWMPALVALVEVCRIVDAPECARSIYERLAPYAQTLCVVSLNLSEMGPVSRALGVLASLMGDYPRAELHFADALATSERIGAPPHVARTSADYARMLLSRGAGDHERACAADASAIHCRTNRAGRRTSRRQRPRGAARGAVTRQTVRTFCASSPFFPGAMSNSTLSLVESSVPVTLDGREVHEDVVPPLDGDEAVALLCVEPLDRAGRCHFVASLLAVPAPMSASVSGRMFKGQ